MGAQQYIFLLGILKNADSESVEKEINKTFHHSKLLPETGYVILDIRLMAPGFFTVGQFAIKKTLN